MKSSTSKTGLTRIYEHHRSMHYYVLQCQHNIYHASTSKFSDQHGYMAGFHCDQSLCDQRMNFA